MKALFLIEDGFEDLELYCPYFRLIEEGVDVDVAARDRKEKVGKHGYTYTPDKSFEEAESREYELLLIPGGKAPEKIRQNKAALAIVTYFSKTKSPIASICHGAQVLISADVLKNRKATSYIGIQDDLANAGAKVFDEEVVVDGNLITSRKPSDIPGFNKEIIKKIREVKK